MHLKRSRTKSWWVLAELKMRDGRSSGFTHSPPSLQFNLTSTHFGDWCRPVLFKYWGALWGRYCKVLQCIDWCTPLLFKYWSAFKYCNALKMRLQKKQRQQQRCRQNPTLLHANLFLSDPCMQLPRIVQYYISVLSGGLKPCEPILEWSGHAVA